MARKPKTERSEEEVLTHAAYLVAGTINPDAMGLTPDKVDVERFVSLFKKKAYEMLEHQETLYLSIGPALILRDRCRSNGIYSDDIKIILDEVERAMSTKFYFHYGILLYVGKHDLLFNWEPH